MAVKRGRPDRGEEREALVKITFKVDRETLEALEALEKTVGAGVRGRRSVFLRRMILAAAGKL